MKSKVELCMLCEELPCSCNTVRKSKPQIKVEKPVALTGPSAAQVAIQQQLSAQRRAAQDKRFSPPQHRRISSVNPDDAALALAIRALEPIMHAESREKFRAILTAPPTLDERGAGWKARREHQDG